jgi:signal transduction histidine kinase
MITDKEILQEGADTEIALLQSRINYLENRLTAAGKKNLSSTSQKIELIQSAISKKVKIKKIIPTAIAMGFIGMLLLGLVEIIIVTFISSLPINISLISIIACGIICGSIAYYFKMKNEELRESVISELVKNEEIEISVERTREDFYERIKKRTSQIWEANKFLKKEIIRRREAEQSVKIFNRELLLNREALEQKNKELEKLNIELKDSEQNLRELNNSKDKFFSILAHDLKNPFASIIGLADFLNEEIPHLNTEEAKKLSRSISNSAKRVHRLLENLLKWSLIQTGRIQFDPTEFNIKSLIDETAELFVQTAESKNIELKIEYGHHRLVFADFNMIETAIRNLISNAVKFTKPGGSVVVKTNQQKQFVRVDIIDNGIGIKESDLNKIFCIEEHTNIAGTGNEKGTGIGLVLSKEFVEKNGGKIWFKSELGKGSEFNITIPIAKENSKALFDDYRLSSDDF